jgi:acyl-CoA thioester hydrolase
MSQSASAEAPVTYRGTVYPWQCDHVGHMNVMWYVGKFDEATWAFFATLGLTPSALREGGRGMAAVEQSIAYRRELLPGDVVTVRTRLVEMRAKAVRFAHEMVNEETGEVAATTELTAVHMDTAARRACPFPDAVAARGRALAEGRP